MSTESNTPKTPSPAPDAGLVPQVTAEAVAKAASEHVPPEQKLMTGIRELYRKDPTPPNQEATKNETPNQEAKKQDATKQDSSKQETKPDDKKQVSVFEKLNKKDEKKGESAPVEDPLAHIEAPKEMSEKASEHWNRLKKEAQTKIADAEKRYKEAQSQIETYKKATPAETAEVEKLKSDYKAAMDRLAVLDIQSHPDFINQYKEPKLKALNEAKEILSYNGNDSADLAQLMAKPLKDFNKTVAEMTREMNGMDATTVQASLRQAYKLAQEEKNALGNASGLREQLESKSALESKKAFEETWGNFGGAENFLSTVEIPEDAAPEEKTELSEYNQAIQQVRQNAEKYAFGRIDSRTAAQVASKAAILDTMVNVVVPRMNKEYSQILSERNALAAELKAIRGAKNPGNFSTTPSANTNDPKVEYQKAREGLKAAFR